MSTQSIFRLFFLVLSVGMFASMGFAQADQFGPGYYEFAQMIRQGQKSCNQSSQCSDSFFRYQVLYELESPASFLLTPELIQALETVAKEQSYIWADTILEGEYEAEGDTRLEKVEGVFADGHLVAYRITYSEKAWYTGLCDYDFEDKSTLRDCAEGRIAESTFVSLDLTSWMRDENAFADFFY